MQLTDEQRAVLAHVVEHPNDWYQTAVASFGEEQARQMMEAKVARWKPDSLANKDKPGYKTRVEQKTI